MNIETEGMAEAFDYLGADCICVAVVILLEFSCNHGSYYVKDLGTRFFILALWSVENITYIEVKGAVAVKSAFLLS